jgi:hypothetical protein
VAVGVTLVDGDSVLGGPQAMPTDRKSATSSSVVLRSLLRQVLHLESIIRLIWDYPTHPKPT